jgi:hypothetical protein
VPELGTEVDDRPGSAGKGFGDVFEYDVVLSSSPGRIQPADLATRIEHFPHGIERNIIERAFLIERSQ